MFSWYCKMIEFGIGTKSSANTTLHNVGCTMDSFDGIDITLT